MKSINQWTLLSKDVLNTIIDGSTCFMCYMRDSIIEYIVFYTNGFGFSISKTRNGEDTWEIIMLKGTDPNECEFYYESTITDFDVIRYLTDNSIIPLANEIKNYTGRD